LHENEAPKLAPIRSPSVEQLAPGEGWGLPGEDTFQRVSESTQRRSQCVELRRIGLGAVDDPRHSVHHTADRWIRRHRAQHRLRCDERCRRVRDVIDGSEQDAFTREEGTAVRPPYLAEVTRHFRRQCFGQRCRRQLG